MGGVVYPSERVERVMEAQEFAQALMFRLQCLDTFYFNVKQGIINEMHASIREITHWYPRIQNARQASSQTETYNRDATIMKSQNCKSSATNLIMIRGILIP